MDGYFHDQLIELVKTAEKSNFVFVIRTIPSPIVKGTGIVVVTAIRSLLKN